MTEQQPPAEAWTYEGVVRRFSEDLAAVERQIVANLGSPNELLEAMASHVVRSGGKRLRPLLVIATARLGGYAGEQHVPLGNVVEYLHAATLLHDDVLDDAPLRRGRPSANKTWGNHLAVLGGDFLYTKAFEILLATAPRDIIRVLCRCSLDMIEGEVLQRQWRGRPAITEETYLAIVERKTASLIAGCCRSGALLAGLGAERADALGAFGRDLGIAFQIIDDTLDYLADPARLGKSLGGDLRQGTITLPLIHLLGREGDPEIDRVREALEAGDVSDADVAAISRLLVEHGCGRTAMDRARHFAESGRRALAPFAGTPLHGALIAAADFVVRRDL